MKKIWVVLLTAIILAILLGGGFYYLNKQYVKEKSDLQAQIDSLSAQIAAEKTASSTTATSTNDASSWKTYTNTQFGFSIKYRSSYTAVNASSYTSDDGVFIYSSADTSHGTLVGVEAQAASGSLDVNVAGKTHDGTFTQAAKTTLGGAEAYEGIEHGALNSYAIIAIKGLKIVEVICDTGNVDNLSTSKAALTEIQKQIIASFQFTK